MFVQKTDNIDKPYKMYNKIVYMFYEMHYMWFAKLIFLAVTSPVWHTSASNYLSQIACVILWQYPFVPPINPTYKNAKWNQWIWASVYGKCALATFYKYYQGAFSVKNVIYVYLSIQEQDGCIH